MTENPKEIADAIAQQHGFKNFEALKHSPRQKPRRSVASRQIITTLVEKNVRKTDIAKMFGVDNSLISYYLKTEA